MRWVIEEQQEKIKEIFGGEMLTSASSKINLKSYALWKLNKLKAWNVFVLYFLLKVCGYFLEVQNHSTIANSEFGRKPSTVNINFTLIHLMDTTR